MMCDVCTPLPAGKREDRHTSTVDGADAYQRLLENFPQTTLDRRARELEHAVDRGYDPTEQYDR